MTPITRKIDNKFRGVPDRLLTVFTEIGCYALNLIFIYSINFFKLE
jgi:hypothetical protein